MTALFRANNLSQFPRLIHAFSTRHYGNLSRQWAKTDAERFQTDAAQKKLLADASLNSKKIISPYQSNSNTVILIDKDSTQTPCRADGLVTNLAGVPLMVYTADCLPVFFYDPVRNAIGAAHVGWRGILNRLAIKIIELMSDHYHTHAHNLLIAIGPAIGVCHFEVRGDVWKPFRKRYTAAEVFRENDARQYLDLRLALKEDLIGASIAAENIEIINACTFCSPDDFFSRRRNPEFRKAMGNVIALGEK